MWALNESPIKHLWISTRMLKWKKALCLIKGLVAADQYYFVRLVLLTFLFCSQRIQQEVQDPKSKKRDVKAGISRAILKSACYLFAASLHMECTHASGCCGHPSETSSCPREKWCWKSKVSTSTSARGGRRNWRLRPAKVPQLAEFTRRSDWNEIT